MAKSLRAEHVVELIEKFLEEEDFPESSDDEVDLSLRCDFMDEGTGEEILLINTMSSNNALPCESDLLLLTDTQLYSNGKYCMSSIYFSLYEIYVMNKFCLHFRCCH